MLAYTDSVAMTPPPKTHETLTVEAISIPQASGRKHYSFSLSGEQVHDLMTRKLVIVDHWTLTNQNGYQRAPAPARYKKFGRFIQQDDGWCPLSVMLYARNHDNVAVKPLNGKHHGFHELKIELSDAHPLYIPDGQHRLEGLRHAYETNPEKMANYHLPVMLMVARKGEDSRFEEATQFHIINSEQKRVKTDLAQRYLLRKKEELVGKIQPNDELPVKYTLKELKPYAVWIVDRLNADRNGPWHDLIAVPSGKSRPDGGVRPISQNMFVESILPVIRYGCQWGWPVGKVRDIIAAFWTAVADPDVMGEAMMHWKDDGHADDDDHTKYILRTTSGVFSMNMLLGHLVGWHTITKNAADPHVWMRLFDKCEGPQFEPQWWESGNEDGASSYGSSAKSFGEIFEELRTEATQYLDDLA
jgi:DGQHR domain-containing protein